MMKIAIVGIGGMGTVHYSNYKYIENAKVVAVCDAFATPPEGVKHYKDLEEMLKSESVDVVDICTPTFLHYDQIKIALSHGVNVICEKPLSLSKANANEVLQMAKDKGVKLFVGHVLHYAKEIMALKEIVNSKKYGEVISGDFTRLSQTPFWAQGGWLFDKKKSGGVAFDLHIHDLDLIVELFGKPKANKMNVAGTPENCHYSFMYEYDDKYVKSESGWLRGMIPFTAKFRVCFEKAVLTLENGVMKVFKADSCEEIDITEDTLIPTGINLPPTGMFKRELEDFLSDIQNESYKGCKREGEILNVIEILEQY